MTMPDLHSHPAQTAARAAALDRYFALNVTASGALTCATGEQCQGSHSGTFYPAQLHHVGRHYGLTRDGKPLRIVVVAQEYGHRPLAARSEMIVRESGIDGRMDAK